MKAASVVGPSLVRVGDEQDPSPGPGEMLVSMRSCGICGSDLEKVFGKYGQPSMRLGHEPAGVVAAIGDRLDGDNTLDGFSVGDRVFTHHHVPCYSCHMCRHGRETMCERYSKTNLSPCGLSEQYVVPAWSVSHGGVLLLPDSVSFDMAAMIEPLACCVRAWSRMDHRPKDTVAVFGVGPTGVMHAMLSAMYGSARTICLDMNDYRLQFAHDVVSGMDSAVETIRSDDPARKSIIFERTENRGADVSIVATGSIAALEDAIASTRRGGTVMMFGVPSRGSTITVDMADVYSREITIASSYAASDADTAGALQLIESKRIDVGRLITHKYPLSDTQRAFEHARTGSDAMKIVIKHD